MAQQFRKFIIRWLANTAGFWLAISLLSKVSLDGGWKSLLLAGLVFSIINSVIRPILVIFSLPFILFTLGAFMLIVNGAMVSLTSVLYDEFHVATFFSAILAGMIIGVVNYIVSLFIDTDYKEA